MLRNGNLYIYNEIYCDSYGSGNQSSVYVSFGLGWIRLYNRRYVVAWRDLADLGIWCILSILENSSVGERLEDFNSYVKKLKKHWLVAITEPIPKAFIRQESSSAIFDEDIIGSTQIPLGGSH